MSATNAERRPRYEGAASKTAGTQSGFRIALRGLLRSLTRRTLKAEQVAVLERVARLEGAVSALRVSSGGGLR